MPHARGPPFPPPVDAGHRRLLPQRTAHLPPHRSAPRPVCSRPLIAPSLLSSIVLMASKGRYISRGPWTRVLEKLGADKGLKLKGEGFGLGFT